MSYLFVTNQILRIDIDYFIPSAQLYPKGRGKQLLPGNAAVLFGRIALKNSRDVVIAVLAAFMFGFGVNPIWALLIAAILGLARSPKTPIRQSLTESPARPHFPTALLLLVAPSAAGFGLLFRFQRKLFDLAALMSIVDLSAFGAGSLPSLSCFTKSFRCGDGWTARLF